MPLYDFACTNEKCAHEWEEFASLEKAEANLVTCPKCLATAQRLVTAHVPVSVTWSTWRIDHNYDR